LVTAFVWLRRPIGRVAGISMTLGYLAYMTILLILG
jgi:hypothetical protein